MVFQKKQVEKESTFSTTDEIKYNDKISVRPYFEPQKENMGLENYEMTLFEGIIHKEQLAAIEGNDGSIRYINGLNEFAPEIKRMEDGEDKTAKIREIRTIVAYIEKDKYGEHLNIEDKDFWSKVTHLKHNNHSFWNNISITVGNEPLFLNPKENIDHLILVRAIEAGGFSMIAKSLEDARSMEKPPKFYLDKTSETVSTRTEITKMKNKALAQLSELYDNNVNKLFYIAKCLDGNGIQFKKTTPHDILYESMDKYINGLSIESTVKKAAKTFLEACNLDMETLKLKAVVKDSVFYKTIISKADGYIYHKDTLTLMGRNVTECVEFLKNPVNEDVLSAMLNTTEKRWIK